MSPTLIRTTLFKVTDPDHFPRLVESYQTLAATAQKDGKPYFVTEPKCGPALKEDRANGYNFVAQTVFASREDMAYYDTDCEAHKKLKADNQGKIAGPPMVICFWSDGQYREKL